MSFTGKPEGYNLHPFYIQPSKSELTIILLIFQGRLFFNHEPELQM